MDKYAFFTKYGVNEAEFENLGLNWDDLMDVYDEYTGRLPVYEDAARFIADLLNKEKSIHSIKYRVKDREHLIEKIIRKSSGDPEFLKTYANYEKNVKDLIGLRALHLFKEDWVDIHRFISGNWEFYTPPRASYKKGDPQALLDMYAEAGFELNEHRNGYRSIHYHLLIKPGRQEMVAEVQVRTLFEEAWSEIDHYFRYGPNKEESQIESYLGILNNITSNADALASHMNMVETQNKQASFDETVLKQTEPQVNVHDVYKKVRYG